MRLHHHGFRAAAPRSSWSSAWRWRAPLIGALWAWLAPPIHSVVALTKSGDRVQAALGSEADNFFIAAFLLVGMVVALAVVCAVLVWQWRAHRGPVLVAALAIGSAVAAGAAAGVGALLVRWRYGTIDIVAAPVSPEHRVHYVIEAPPVFFGHTPLQIAATIMFPAAMAALVYALIAVSTVTRRSGWLAAGRSRCCRGAGHSGRALYRPSP